MKFFWFAALLLSVSLEAKQLSVQLSAPSAVLINAQTGKVLYEKQAHTKRPPASITKIATAYYILEKIGAGRLDETVVVQNAPLPVLAPASRARSIEFAHYLEYGAGALGLVSGEKMTFRLLLDALLVASMNDAANVLAQACSGSVPLFMEEVNRFLQQKGLKQTHFVNPHGLDFQDHYTTAYDMAMLGKMAMENPLFREFVKKEKAMLPQSNKHPAQLLKQTNRLLRTNSPQYYPKAIGIKTGFTSKAGNTLVAAAQDENRSLIAVVLGCQDSQTRFKETTLLFEAAFNEKRVERPLFAQGYDHFTCSVKGGKNALQAVLEENLTLTYYPSEEPQVKALLKWYPVKMPIYHGDRVGEIEVVAEDGRVVKRGFIAAEADVEPTLLFQIELFFKEKRKAVLSLLLITLIAAGLFSILRKNRVVQKAR